MDIVERLMQQIETGPDVEDIVFINPDGPEAADEIERLQYALMKVCNSLDDNLPAIITKNIALAALGLPLRGMSDAP